MFQIAYLILDTRISCSVLRPPPSRSGYPPWNLKRAGLESSGQIASSLYWKTFGFLGFLKIFWIISDFFVDFLDFILIFLWIGWFFLDFSVEFWFGWFGFLDPFKVSKVTTKIYQGYYCTPEVTKNGPKQLYSLFFCQKGKKSLGRSPQTRPA